METGNFMLRHSWPGWGDYLSQLSILMSRQSWPRGRNSVVTKDYM